MTDAPSPRPSRALSPAARTLRLQRIFARLQDGASSPRRRGRGYDGPDYKRMQMARLTPALRLAAERPRMAIDMRATA